MSGRDIEDFHIRHAIATIYELYGVRVSVNKKKKDLIKFGYSDQTQTTATTLMELPTGTYNETYVYRNIIDKVSSSSTADVNKIVVEGHKVGSDKSVTSLTQSSGIATATVTGHGGNTGDWYYIEGANETEYNGIVQITRINNNTFTYEVDSGASSPATGTITATNQKKTFVTQTVTLNGRNKVTLETPLARSTRAYVTVYNKATDTAGDVYIYEDDTITLGVPDTDTKVHLMIKGTSQYNQSQKASTTLSSTDYWIIRGIHGHVLDKSITYADVIMEKRLLGGVWREIDNVAVSGQSATSSVNFIPYVVIPANADIRLVASADMNGRKVGGSIQGWLATSLISQQ